MLLLRALPLCLALLVGVFPTAEAFRTSSPPFALRRVEALPTEFQARAAELGYQHVGRVDPETVVSFKIFLHLNNLEELQRLHDDRAHPDSPNFLRWPSHDHLMTLTTPEPHVVALCQQWIESSGMRVKHMGSNKAMVHVEGPARHAEAWLRTELHTYQRGGDDAGHRQHGSTGDEASPEVISGHRDVLIRKHGAHSVPADLLTHLATITNLSSVPHSVYRRPLKKSSSSKPVPSSSQNSHTSKAMDRQADKTSAASDATNNNEDSLKNGRTNSHSPQLSKRAVSDTHSSPQSGAFAPPTTGGINFGPETIFFQASIVCSGANISVCGQQCVPAATSITVVVFLCQPFSPTYSCSKVYNRYVIPISTLDTFPSACSCDSSLSYYYCQITVPSVPNAFVGVGYSIQYADSSSSGFGYFQPTPTVAAATPQLLSTLYNIPSNAHVTSSSTQSVLEFYNPGIGMSQADANQYLSSMGKPLQPNLIVTSPVPAVPNSADGEGSLDIQVMLGLAPGATNHYINTGTTNLDDSFWSQCFQYLLDPPPGLNFTVAPQVISISWMSCEPGVNIPLAEQWALLLATHGTTIVACTGDYGYIGGCTPHGTCANPLAIYPATSQYATAVGATMLSRSSTTFCTNNPSYCGGTNAFSESVCSQCAGATITSGGGFSASISTPAYMQSVQEQYRSMVAAGVNQPSSYQSTPPLPAGKRGFPDVAALGHIYPIYVNGELNFVDGTSASTPAFAAIVTLLNSLLPAGQTMGSMNTFLYTMAGRFPRAFNDVVVGDNSCFAIPSPPGTQSGSSQNACTTGYYALPGWDAATGLGSVNFEALRSLVLDPTGGSLLRGSVPAPSGSTTPPASCSCKADLTISIVAIVVAFAAVVLTIVLWYCYARHAGSGAQRKADPLTYALNSPDSSES